MEPKRATGIISFKIIEKNQNLSRGSYPFAWIENSYTRPFVVGVLSLKNKYNVLCITPINHLKNTRKLLEKNNKFIYRPYINKIELKKFLAKNNNINALFCNPNKQGFVLDRETLEGSNIKCINTASTGTNHINLSDCKLLKIKVLSLKNDKSLINNLPRLVNYHLSNDFSLTN